MKKTIIILTSMVTICVAIFFVFKSNEEDTSTKNVLNIVNDKSLSFDYPADNRFGFLVGPPSEEMQEVREIGAGWVRPHPGSFIWGDMQKSATGKIDFSATDDLVRNAATNDIQALVTIWPYAGWDQKNRADYSECRVSSSEFVDEFGWYRCNPNDWEAYKKWVMAFVERYDGDGVDDMPGLQQPIKYWEVFNEPDLQPPSEDPEGLQFYIGGPKDYIDLLYSTSLAIKETDPEAQILIAGAAGSDDQSLDFYQEVFEEMALDSRYPYTDVFDIANVHCISSGDIDSFNVQPYKDLLNKNGLGDKPIWVTEAEAFISSDSAQVATKTKLSTLEAFKLGAEKIFYTSRDFKNKPGAGSKIPQGDDDLVTDTSLNASDPESVFRAIMESVN